MPSMQWQILKVFNWGKLNSLKRVRTRKIFGPATVSDFHGVQLDVLHVQPMIGEKPNHFQKHGLAAAARQVV